jgi:hypothetical protein
MVTRYQMDNGKVFHVVADVYPEEISASISKSCGKIEIDWTYVDPAVIHMLISDNISVTRNEKQNYLIPLEMRDTFVKQAEAFGQRVKFTRVVS